MASGRGVVVGFLMGGLIGAAVALLLAPARGEETRRLVRSSAQPAVSKIRDMALAKRSEAPAEEEDELA